ncbi:MAG TPA: glycoside hydrolase [Blastocatellia bacterium]|nr:glycoside hydrolase [Blastocatellia bacterium]
MTVVARTLTRAVGLILIAISASLATAQQFSPTLYQNLRWRCIGPHRGGRTVGATGVPGQANVFYIGVNNGGVWKSNDYGVTWKPIFDDQPTGSIGALAVAPSNPDIVYVGSGEGLQRPDLSTGDGIYKSTDAGKSWKHLGLRDAQQIGAIIVDPRDPNRLFVAALGHPYGPNEERGVFRSTDGGDSFQKVLYKDENTGAIALQFDPSNSQTIYTDLWAGRQGPWENGAWQGPNSGLFKSTDGGNTWRKLTKGLPTFEQGLGRIGFCVAPSAPKRIYALVDASPQLGGLYRSDDAGESWRRVSNDARPWGRGSDFAEVKVDPKNPDIIYSANVVTWRSTDAGQNWVAFRGAPGGDDYHTVWINPDDTKIILLASDQGAIITVNGGQSWSSWYNQPTAQFYHVITDNRFPYWVYGGQQESGSVGIASRGNDGQITFREWHPVGVEEYGYVAPDPLNPNMIYGGKITRFDWSTGQVQNIAPDPVRAGKHRFLRTAPVIFSPVDPHVLYFAGNVLFKTTSGGNSWDIISPDLSREQPDVPESIGVYRTPEMAKQPRRGVIYTVAPSYKDVNVIWAGTDDGLIHVTRDGGKAWSNVTPPALTPWSKVSIMDAGRFDANTAYAAVNRIRLDDQRPHIYRTHDGGKTWKEIVNDLGDSGPINVVREDPVRRGLLFCGSERGVYVSFNDGDTWQPLRLNMPASSIRDLVIKDDDIVVGTHGRSFWILDDITPLRQISEEVAAADAFLFKPELTYRVRWNMNTDTPLPPDEPAGKNPPDGAIIDYYLKTESSGPVVLEIADSSNKLVRRYSSDDKPDSIEAIGKEVNIPTYWIRPVQILSTRSGMQRFVWDLHYAPPEGERPEYPIAAIYGDTARHPLGPWALPGTYTVKLTVGGRSYTQSLTIKMDPRVKTSPDGLSQQHAIAMRCYDGQKQVHDALTQVRKLRSQLRDLRGRAAQGALADAINALERKAGALEGAGGGFRGGGGGGRASAEPSLSAVNGELLGLMGLVEGADVTPTTQAVAASGQIQQTLAGVLSRWSEIKEKDVKALNEQLVKAGLPALAY